MNNCDTVQCFEHKWNIWHAAYIQHFSYQYLNKCFLRCIHTLWNCSHAVGRCNFKRSDSWQAATVMNFSSRRVDWLKSGGGADGERIFEDGHRDVTQVSHCWNRRVKLSRCDIWANNLWPWQCMRVGVWKDKASFKQLWIATGKCVTTHLPPSSRNAPPPELALAKFHPTGFIWSSILIRYFSFFLTFASPFHHIILQGSQDLRH